MTNALPRRISTLASKSGRFVLAVGLGSLLPPVAKGQDAAAPAATRKVITVEGITEYVLTNGLQVLLFPDPSRPTVTVNVTYRVGSRHEGRGEAGMAHLLEHMVFKGTPTFANIWGALEDHGARFNGTTWVDRTNYFETLPASDENLEFALHMEADRMVNSTISGEELAKEMTVVRNEFEMGENNPTGVLSERMTSAAFLWHNYGKSTIGNRSDIERVPVENLRRFYQTYYQADNATLVVAGKFDPDKALALIGKYFGAIPRPARVLENTYTEEPAQDGPKMVTLERVGDVAAAGVVYHVPAGAHPDYPAVEVLEGVLTSQPSGRLYQALVQTGLAASVSGNAFSWAEPGIMEIMAEVRLDKDARKALDEMIRVVEGVAAADISADEVERIKTQLLKDIKLAMTQSGRIGVRLSEAVAKGDWRLFFIHRDRLKEVTLEDVRRVARTYLVSSNRTAGLFIPTKEPSRAPIPQAPEVSTIVEGYRGTEEIASGEAFVATPMAIEERVQRLALPSGINVALLSKETRGDAVVARFVFRFGTEESLNGHREAVRLIPNLLMRGTTKKTHQELRDAIDKLQSRIVVGGGGWWGRRGAGGGGDSMGSASAFIESDRAHVEAAIELLGEILQSPAFDPAEFDTVVTQQLAWNEERLSDPMARGMNALARTISPWPQDSIHYVPTLEEEIEQLRSVSLGEVKDLYGRLYGAGSASVAIVGDFDADATREVVQRVFGAWKAPSAYARVAKPHRTYTEADLAIETPDKEMAIVGLSAAFELRDDDPDYPALSFAAYVLGQSAKSRLINRLRHQGGLSYGAGAAFRADNQDRRASLTASAICAPQNATTAMDAMQEEVARWVSDGLTPAELAEGKSSFALKFENNLADDRFILAHLSEDLEIDRTLEYQDRLLKSIAALTEDDVRRVLQKHLGSAAWVRVKAGDLSRRVESAAAPTAPNEMAGPDAMPADASETLPEQLSRFDANGDGKLQKSEAPERILPMFERLDANQDGAIDATEAKAMRGVRREGKGAASLED